MNKYAVGLNLFFLDSVNLGGNANLTGPLRFTFVLVILVNKPNFD